MCYCTLFSAFYKLCAGFFFCFFLMWVSKILRWKKLCVTWYQLSNMDKTYSMDVQFLCVSKGLKLNSNGRRNLICIVFQLFEITSLFTVLKWRSPKLKSPLVISISSKLKRSCPAWLSTHLKIKPRIPCCSWPCISLMQVGVKLIPVTEIKWNVPGN